MGKGNRIMENKPRPTTDSFGEWYLYAIHLETKIAKCLNELEVYQERHRDSKNNFATICRLRSEIKRITNMFIELWDVANESAKVRREFMGFGPMTHLEWTLWKYRKEKKQWMKNLQSK